MEGIELTTDQVAALRAQVMHQRMRRHKERRVPMLYLGGPLDGMRSTVEAWMVRMPESIVGHRVGEGAGELEVSYVHRGGGCFVFREVRPFNHGGGCGHPWGGRATTPSQSSAPPAPP